jgi:hypothetical protein
MALGLGGVELGPRGLVAVVLALLFALGIGGVLSLPLIGRGLAALGSVGTAIIGLSITASTIPFLAGVIALGLAAILGGAPTFVIATNRLRSTARSS